MSTLTNSASLFKESHRRYNPLMNSWILVSPHRTKRPWKGQQEADSGNDEFLKPDFDPTNPLCPGVTRPNGIKNPLYTSVFVFENDFSALVDEPSREEVIEASEVEHVVESADAEVGDLFRAEKGSGRCEVVCFHPKSNVTLPLMTLEEIENVVTEWQDRLRVLGEDHAWVQIFENKGAIMGCSNPHPHCQIWASKFLPDIPATKDVNQQTFYQKHGRPMLLAYLEAELKQAKRIVFETDHFVCLVPFWAVWPYETMILPKRHIVRLTDITSTEKKDLCKVMKQLLTKYDNLFKCSFPYSMGWHGAPTGHFLSENVDHWQLHASYYPPLLRSATVKKFMVGYELLAEPQRDITAEDAANTLRELSGSEHFFKQHT